MIAVNEGSHCGGAENLGPDWKMQDLAVARLGLVSPVFSLKTDYLFYSSPSFNRPIFSFKN